MKSKIFGLVRGNLPLVIDRNTSGSWWISYVVLPFARRNCLICNKSFVQKQILNKEQIYCTRACLMVAGHKRHYEASLIKAKAKRLNARKTTIFCCINCGKLVRDKSRSGPPKTKFCSRSCKNSLVNKKYVKRVSNVVNAAVELGLVTKTQLRVRARNDTNGHYIKTRRTKDNKPYNKRRLAIYQAMKKLGLISTNGALK